MQTDYRKHARGTLGSLIFNSAGGILGDTAHAESVPPDLAKGIAEGRYFVAVDDGLPGNGPQPGDWLSSITAVIPKMAAFAAAEDFARVNANRAAAGLEPVRVLQYGPQCKTLSRWVPSAPPGDKAYTTKTRKFFPSYRRLAMQLSRSDYSSTAPGSLVFQERHAQRLAPARLGAWVQNPETGEWYDDGTGALISPPAGADVPGTLPDSSAAGPGGWLDAIVGALPKVSAFLTAEQLAQVNVDRAKRGLPALQTSQYAPQVGVGFDPGTTKLITMVGVGLAAVILVPKFLGRRKSRR